MSEKPQVNFCDGSWKIGDEVWAGSDWMPIADISDTEVMVGGVWYGSDGRWSKDRAFPAIFPNEFEIPAEAYERPVERPNLPMDTPVWVRKGGYWRPKHSAGWTPDGRMKYWLDGGTSHTAEGRWVSTDEWRLDDPAKDKR